MKGRQDGRRDGRKDRHRDGHWDRHKIYQEAQAYAWILLRCSYRVGHRFRRVVVMTVRVCGITDYHPLQTIWLHRLFLGCSIFWKPLGTEDGT